ncbi:multiple sugar transport system substrate-binding protein [Caldicoprobacter guelmensis]|uniref:ABC transporter substrate-binding protein n=1 Tax=Caldicoprobacter guelmensis TaxID=1170224 RepID=UPI00195E5F0E|nr:extracellular solute-binding protein [Caldicoprobacter guelmensis]MBM7583239.1 multiple sugar transport system substrate-binding protein [Caldicoprobacter guelmensis]
MKKFIALLLCVLMMVSIVLLSGCGEKKSSTPSDDTKSNENTNEGNIGKEQTGNSTSNQNVEIRAAWWGDTKRHELYNQIIDRFEAANPGIKVVREPVSWVDYWDKLTVQSASGEAPDFMGMHPQFASDYVGRGVIEPLDKYVKDGVIDLSNFSEAAINSGKVNGTIYMVSMGLTAASMFVNATFLKDLGIQVPNFDWTWDDFKSLGLEVRKALDAKGQKDRWFAGDGSGAYQFFRYWARQRGGDLYTAEGDLGYDEEDLVTWFKMWNELRESGVVPDAATTTEYAKATLEDSLFAKKKIAATSVPANQYKLYCNAVPDSEIIIVRHPAMKDGQIGEYIEGAHFAISAKTTPEKKVAAAKLLNFWVNSESSMEIYKLDQGVPANTKMAEFIIPLLDDKDKVIVEYVNKVSKIARPTTFPPAGASEIDALFQTIAESVRFNQKTPEAAAAELVAEAKKILASKKQ